jgi:hypothetical protein
MPPPLPRSPSGSGSRKTSSSRSSYSVSHSNGKDPLQIAKLVKLPQKEKTKAHLRHFLTTKAYKTRNAKLRAEAKAEAALQKQYARVRKTEMREKRVQEVASRRTTRRKAQHLQQGNREIKREKRKFYHDLAKKVLGKNFLRPGQISLVERHLGERMSVSGSAQEETLYEELRRSERAARYRSSSGSSSSSSNSNHSAYDLSSSGSGPKKPPPRKYKPMDEM